MRTDCRDLTSTFWPPSEERQIRFWPMASSALALDILTCLPSSVEGSEAVESCCKLVTAPGEPPLVWPGWGLVPPAASVCCDVRATPIVCPFCAASRSGQL